MDKGTIVLIACGVLVVTNLISFFLMWKDKNAAKKGAWRVKERTLFIVTGCFGGLGGVLGMQLLRHKTKHWYFKVFFPVMLVIQIVLRSLGMKFFAISAG